MSSKSPRDLPPGASGDSPAIDDAEPLRTALRESRERYDRLFAESTQGIVVTDAEHKVRSFNPAAERLLGLHLASVVGQDFARCAGPFSLEDGSELAPQALPHVRAVAEQRPVGSLAFKVINHANGRWRWVLASATPFYRADEDEPYEVVTSFTNINVLKRTEEVSRRREATWRRIFNSTSDALFVHDSRTGKIVDVNETAAQMYGYSSAELLERTIVDLTANPTEETMDLALRHVAEATEHGSAVFDWLVRRRDGSTFEAEVALKTTEIAGEPRVIASVRDVTARRRAERALQRQRSFEALVARISSRFLNLPAEEVDRHIERALAELASLVEVPLTLVVRRTGGENEAATTHSWQREPPLVSRSALHAPTRSLPDSWHRDDYVPSAVEHTPSSDAARDWEDLWNAGAKRLLLAPLEYEGQVIGALGVAGIEDREWAHDEVAMLGVLAQIFSNALERLRIEREKELLREQLLQSQKMEAIGRLAGGVAHDFNNILTGIIGYAEMMLEELDPATTLYGDATEVHRAASRAASLTGQLLAFSRKQIAKPREIDVNAVVGNAKKMLSRIIGEDIELVFRPAAERATINADPAQLDQILVNLASNARDAMPRGGKLVIEVDTIHLDEATAAAQPGTEPGDFVVISVSDVGQGMSADVQARIFEPFFTTKELGQGTGLGLSTVYGIVRQNGGFVTVYSQPDVGTTLRLYLPICGPPIEEATENEEPLASEGGETILLVEDEHIVRQLAQRVLARRGYRVLVAADGEGALAEYGHRDDLRLLLTDVVMPGMNGRQLYDALSAKHPRLRVLYMSGYAENVIAHHGVLAPGTPFLPKPFSVAALVRMVRKVLSAAEADDEHGPGLL